MLDLLRRRQVSAEELTKHSLERALAMQPKLNAFVLIDEDSALASASATDTARLAGEPVGRLAGVPTSVKDNIDVRGMVTTFGSRTRTDNMCAEDAASVERLRGGGCPILGKTTLTEFACKAGGGDSPLTGVTRNAWNPSRTTGGSSAGAATSVAAGVSPFALGTDGGGSVRIPASLCGVFGIKAQFGRVPVYPVSANPTLAHVGVLSRSVKDAALVLEVISGFDPRDPFTVAAEVPAWVGACNGDVKGLRVLWSPTLGYARPSREVVDIAQRALRSLEGLGAYIEERDEVLPDPIDLWMWEYYAGAGTRLREVVRSSPHLLDPAVLELLKEAISARTLEEYYARVFERFAFRERVRMLFQGVDILLTPTLPVTAFEAGRNIPQGFEDRNLASWVYYTYPFNLTGNPAASIPCGFDAEGLPVGLQAVSPAYCEVNVFKIASALEGVNPWADRAPEV